MTCAGAVGWINPRSSSATGSSFLFLMAPITSGLSRSPQSGEMAVSSWTASPSVNQRGTRCPVAALDRDKVGHVFNHADSAVVAPGIGAHGAQGFLGQVAATAAPVDRERCLPKRLDKR